MVVNDSNAESDEEREEDAQDHAFIKEDGDAADISDEEFDGLRTRSELVSKLRSGDDLVWADFQKLYEPVLLSWARAYGLDARTAKAIVSELYSNLFRSIHRLKYDRSQSFRGYLRVILRNLAIAENVRQARLNELFEFDENVDRPPNHAEKSILSHLVSLETRNFELQARKEVLEEVPAIQSAVWIAMTDGVASKDVIAKELEISRATLYRIKAEVSRRMKDRYRELSGDDD